MDKEKYLKCEACDEMKPDDTKYMCHDCFVKWKNLFVKKSDLKEILEEIKKGMDNKDDKFLNAIACNVWLIGKLEDLIEEKIENGKTKI